MTEPPLSSIFGRDTPTRYSSVTVGISYGPTEGYPGRPAIKTDKKSLLMVFPLRLVAYSLNLTFFPVS